MGVSVRRKGNNFYIFIRHNGDRAARKYKSEEEAQDVAKAVRHAITLGQFDIAALKKARAASAVEEKTLTLKDYYEKTVRSLWEGSLSRNTYQSYDGSFRVHILPALGDFAFPDLTRDRVKKFVADLRKKYVTIPAKKEQPDEAKTESPAQEKSSQAKPPRLLAKETIRKVVAALRAGLTEAVENNLIIANPAVKLGKFYKEASDFHEEIDAFAVSQRSCSPSCKN